METVQNSKQNVDLNSHSNISAVTLSNKPPRVKFLPYKKKLDIEVSRLTSQV